jgi:hypothetical protein
VNPGVAPQIQVVSTLVLAALLGWVIYLVRYHRLSLRDSLAWLLSTAAALVIAAFPALLGEAADALGVAVPANALFAFAFAYTLLNLLAATVAISANASRIRRLAQECALLRGELDELRAKVDASTREP